MTIVEKDSWDNFLAKCSDAHILQTSNWGQFKQNQGWYVNWLIVGDSGAQILFKKLPMKQTFAYIPKGPIGDNWDAVIHEAIELCKTKNAFVLYIEPDAWEQDFLSSLDSFGFTRSPISIQPRRTISISLESGEDEWLSNMKQKTRYNIRLAQKKEIVVEKSKDIDKFIEVMKVTGARDEFGIHTGEYYKDVFNMFSANGSCELLLASYQNIPLAGIMVFARGKRAWYFYGASNDQERNRMPTYLLQFEGMKWAASKGCTEYDLWGIPDVDEFVLERDFANRSDGLWGVYRFKRGFGGQMKRTAGVFQKVFNKPKYWLYSVLLKIRK